MYYLKLFESFNSNQLRTEIESICSTYNIKNYTINNDGTIDVIGNVYFNDLKLEKIPLKFNRVQGAFSCSNSKLITLEGCPFEVTRYFDCSNNRLTSLTGCPTYIGEYFDCNNNKLINLEGGPIKIGNRYPYIALSNRLINLKGAPEKIDGDFYINNNPLPELIFKNMDNIKKILEYQDIYDIWNSDGSLNEYRFNIMMEEI